MSPSPCDFPKPLMKLLYHRQSGLALRAYEGYQQSPHCASAVRFTTDGLAIPPQVWHALRSLYPSPVILSNVEFTCFFGQTYPKQYPTTSSGFVAKSGSGSGGETMTAVVGSSQGIASSGLPTRISGSFVDQNQLIVS